jgi:hypothetical protein
MKKLAIVFAVGAVALLGGSAANASDNSAMKKAPGTTQQSTDISSHGRHHRNYRYHGHHHRYRHYGYRSYRPYYGNSYGYYSPGPSYGYGYGGPGITFSWHRWIPQLVT